MDPVTKLNDYENAHSVDWYQQCDRQLAGMHLGLKIAFPFALRAAIKLGIPDILIEAGPDAQLTAKDIASRIATPKTIAPDSEKLDILLRLLASHNVLTEFATASPSEANDVERRYGRNLIVDSLSSGDGGSLAAYSLLLTDPRFVATLECLPEMVLDGKAQPFVLANGTSFWECLQTDDALDKLFNKAMADPTTLIMPLLLQKYKGFEGLKSVVDVGGNIGTNLAIILSKYPQLRGINFDLPHIVANGLQVRGLEHIGGDFFESVPEGDAVFLKMILHAWNDEHCIKILKNVAKALPPHGKVINIDILLPESSDSSLNTQSGVSFHLLMATYLEGKERTLREYRSLANAAGFSRVEVVAFIGYQTVLEFYKT